MLNLWRTLLNISIHALFPVDMVIEMPQFQGEGHASIGGFSVHPHINSCT